MNQPQIFPSSPLDQVRVGMAVLDADGRPLGKVVRVRQANLVNADSDHDEPHLERGASLIAPALPETGARAGGTGPVLSGGMGLDEPDLPTELRRELVRAGFIKVEGPGLKGAARYVRASRISAVSSDTVRIRA